MSKQIYANHGSIEDAYQKTKGYIDQICSVQQMLQNVDNSLISSWLGEGQNAFISLSNENHAMLKSLIEQTRILNNDLSDANKFFEKADRSLVGDIERVIYE